MQLGRAVLGEARPPLGGEGDSQKERGADRDQRSQPTADCSSSLQLESSCSFLLTTQHPTHLITPTQTLAAEHSHFHSQSPVQKADCSVHCVHAASSSAEQPLLLHRTRCWLHSASSSAHTLAHGRTSLCQTRVDTSMTPSAQPLPAAASLHADCIGRPAAPPCQGQGQRTVHAHAPTEHATASCAAMP